MPVGQILDPVKMHTQLRESGVILTPPPTRRPLETRNDALSDSTQLRSGLTGSFAVAGATANFRQGLLLSIT